MTANQALAAFIALESDIAAKAVARNSSLTCDIPIRFDDATIDIVKIKSSRTGVLTYIDRDGITELTRTEYMAVYVTPYADRLDKLYQAKRDARTAAKNIRSFIRARRRYVADRTAQSFVGHVIMPSPEVALSTSTGNIPTTPRKEDAGEGNPASSVDDVIRNQAPPAPDDPSSAG